MFKWLGRIPRYQLVGVAIIIVVTLFGAGILMVHKYDPNNELLAAARIFPVSKKSIPPIARSTRVLAAKPEVTTRLAVSSKPSVVAPAVKIPLPIPSVTVPILMYHYIRDYNNPSDPEGIDLSVSPESLETQLSAMKAAGYHTISLEDFVDKNYGSGKPFVITFDDGYQDQYDNALPILQSEGMTATFFIISGFVNTPNYMTDAELTTLQADGMEVGAHTVHHRDLAVLDYATAVSEIAPSLVNRAPVFAYPSGEYNSQTLQILEQHGVKAAVTTQEAVATNLDNDLLLPRVRMKNGTDIIPVVKSLIYVALHPTN